MTGKELLAKHHDKLLAAAVTAGLVKYELSRPCPGKELTSWDQIDVTPYELGREYDTVFGVNLPKDKVKICDLVWDEDVSKWTSPGKFRAKYGPGVRSKNMLHVVGGVAGSRPVLAIPNFGQSRKSRRGLQ